MTDTQIKLRIGYPLSDRLAPIACAIVQNITTSTRLIVDLPSAAIEALLDYSREQHPLDQPEEPSWRPFSSMARWLARSAGAGPAVAERHNRRTQGQE
jgi:hypothetical protein